MGVSCFLPHMCLPSPFLLSLTHSTAPTPLARPCLFYTLDLMLLAHAEDTGVQNSILIFKTEGGGKKGGESNVKSY